MLSLAFGLLRKRIIHNTRRFALWIEHCFVGRASSGRRIMFQKARLLHFYTPLISQHQSITRLNAGIDIGHANNRFAEVCEAAVHKFNSAGRPILLVV